MTQAELAAMIDRLAEDSSGRLTPDDRTSALAAAVRRYSQDRPRVIVADLAIIDGGLDLPGGWEQDSAALSLEHPIGQRPPSSLPNEAWYAYQGPGGDRIMFAQGWGGSDNDLARLTYTVGHVCDDNDCTLPDKHLEAVASWGAALLCEALASYYSGNSDSTIQADRVDYNNPSRNFAKRAEALRDRYFKEIGVDPRRNVAAGAVATPVPRDSRGRLRLTHPPTTAAGR